MQQEQFDKEFITSTEVCQDLGIHRCTVLSAVRSGKLPEPITIKRQNGDVHIMLWPRGDVRKVLSAWKAARAA